MKKFRQKLGIQGNQGEDDEQLVAVLLRMMSDIQADFTMTFRQLGDWTMKDITQNNIPKNLWSLPVLRKHEWFGNWRQIYLSRLKNSKWKSDSDRQLSMHSVNPRYVLRNWIAQRIISRVEENDFVLLNLVKDILTKPFTLQEEAEKLGFASKPPKWAKDIKVSCSS